jgi:hypothetical protein
MVGCSGDGADSASSNAESSTTTTSTSDTTDEITLIAPDDLYSKRDKDASWDEATATKITFDKTEVTLDGDGAALGLADGAGDTTVSETVGGKAAVTINTAGTYVLSGTLDDGMIVINASKDDKIQLVFNGVSISNSTGCAIFVASADKTFVTLADNTQNFLNDGSTYSLDADNDEPYAALFSKDDLTINGIGSLNVAGNYAHGICSKDDLVITGGNITVTAKTDAIRGRDSVAICDGNFDITSGEDAIKSNNDEDLSKGYVSIDGGTFAINAGDDAIHGESWLRVNDGDIAISKSYEGLEATQVYVNGGTIDIVASDDGINAAGGLLVSTSNNNGTSKDFGGMNGAGGKGENGGFDKPGDTGNTDTNKPDNQNSQAKGAADATSNSAPVQTVAQTGIGAGGGISSDLYKIEINGGYICVNAQGDSIDSNGSAAVNGGTLLVNCSSNNADEALDYELTATLNGGTVVLLGPTGMSGGFSDATQPFIYTRASGKTDDNVTLAKTDGTVLVNLRAQSSFTTVCISTPEIVDGDTYNLIIGGTISKSDATDDNGYTTSGIVDGGTSTSVTATTSATTTGMEGAQGGTPGNKADGVNPDGDKADIGNAPDAPDGQGFNPEEGNDNEGDNKGQMPNDSGSGRGGAGFGPRTDNTAQNTTGSASA